MGEPGGFQVKKHHVRPRTPIRWLRRVGVRLRLPIQLGILWPLWLWLPQLVLWRLWKRLWLWLPICQHIWQHLWSWVWLWLWLPICLCIWPWIWLWLRLPICLCLWPWLLWLLLDAPKTRDLRRRKSQDEGRREDGLMVVVHRIVYRQKNGQPCKAQDGQPCRKRFGVIKW